MGFSKDDVKSIGVTNQRETTIVWDRKTKKPLYNAISWTDTRTKVMTYKLIDYKSLCGLPLSTYFSSVKLNWLIKEGIAKGDFLFSTVDSWIIFCLTGNHVTDVTNASRTMLMDIRTCQWSDKLLELDS